MLLNRSRILSLILSSLLSAVTPSALSAPALCEDLFKVSDLSLKSDVVELPLVRLNRGFIVPNERHLAPLIPHLKSASPGIYVSVGTERGFLSAAHMGNHLVKALVLVDVDRQVAVFNLVNKALLALAKNQADYYFLRTRANYSELAEYMAQNGAALSAENHFNLANPHNWQWWQSEVQNNPEWAFYQEPHRTNQGAPSPTSNYLFDSSLYEAISQLAKENKIIVFAADLKSPSFARNLAQIAESLQTSISVFDLSNAWENGYLGHLRTIDTLSLFASAYTSESQFVFTYQTIDSRVSSIERIFKYSVVRRGHLRSFEELGLYFSSMIRSMQSSPEKTRPYIRSLDRD